MPVPRGAGGDVLQQPFPRTAADPFRPEAMKIGEIHLIEPNRQRRGHMIRIALRRTAHFDVRRGAARCRAG